MSNAIWQRYPVIPGLHSVEMKDKLQERIMEETRGASPAALIAYFREASRRFRREPGREPANPPIDPPGNSGAGKCLTKSGEIIIM